MRLLFSQKKKEKKILQIEYFRFVIEVYSIYVLLLVHYSTFKVFILKKVVITHF